VATQEMSDLFIRQLSGGYIPQAMYPSFKANVNDREGLGGGLGGGEGGSPLDISLPPDMFAEEFEATVKTVSS
jgi:hypothetical protein